MAISVDFKDLINKDKDAYDIIDIRSSDDFDFGHIPGAINIPETVLENFSKLNKNKEYYICCKSGVKSEDVADTLCENGFKAFSLNAGYIGYLRSQIKEVKNGTIASNAELSLQKKFRKEILSKFLKAIKTYDLIQPNDKIAVCISGGKDSFLMAKLFQELLRFTEIPFEVVFLCMDPGYSKENRELIEVNAKNLNIPLTFFETDIFDSVVNVDKSPCYLCARMRRGHLYSAAEKLGCNKIALGHHFDDVIETILMGMLYGGQIQTMMPKLHSDNFGNMQLIRPLYLIREKDIKHWRDYNNLHFLQCACRFTATCSIDGGNDQTASKRKKVKHIIANIAKDDPCIEQNIFKSIENVNLATVIAYKDKHGTHHSFLDDYDEK
ncbi:MAG: ATPase [Clostridia bacterium]|nr:ATPase [Clostridia bacterium]